MSSNSQLAAIGLSRQTALPQLKFCQHADVSFQPYTSQFHGLSIHFILPALAEENRRREPVKCDVSCGPRGLLLRRLDFAPRVSAYVRSILANATGLMDCNSLGSPARLPVTPSEFKLPKETHPDYDPRPSFGTLCLDSKCTGSALLRALLHPAKPNAVGDNGPAYDVVADMNPTTSAANAICAVVGACAGKRTGCPSPILSLPGLTDVISGKLTPRLLHLYTQINAGHLMPWEAILCIMRMVGEPSSCPYSNRTLPSQLVSSEVHGFPFPFEPVTACVKGSNFHYAGHAARINAASHTPPTAASCPSGPTTRRERDVLCSRAALEPTARNPSTTYTRRP
ncbi:hypothetical protein PCL_02837 [Purpureocillium lilacinum]|uniref:Uncharacterized protein n=1 Tax=Purpureocillium lilacinum TaxID=33203 RepID=A0A2U3DZ11_PURLI|nr:hypothetical protein PCL_02837 [Purpureocillium lilacinum]